MSEKYRVGIEVKSVDYYTLEVELVGCNDIESVLDELERDGIHPDDITDFLSEKNGIKILKTEIEEAGSCEIECPDLDKI